MLRYTYNFMTDRKIRVAVGNDYSSLMTIENGVPQGAVISVTLFLIAINPINNLGNLDTKLIGYADDWVIYTKATKPEIATYRIQNTLNKVNSWFKMNGFKISADKTKSIMITRRCPRGIQPYAMNLKI
jgi:Reverse transcriptase (RNA-dependent DNA polymerase)